MAGLQDANKPHTQNLALPQRTEANSDKRQRGRHVDSALDTLAVVAAGSLVRRGRCYASRR